MKYANKDDIQELLKHVGTPAVTLYMPAHRASSPPHIQEDVTRFKNLIGKAKAQLQENNVASDVFRKIDSSLSELLSNQEFWVHQGDGLAVFVGETGAKTFKLGINITEYVAVDERYHVTPLIIQLEENQSYAALALAVHEPKLFMGDAVHIELSDLELPQNPEQALDIDEMHINKLQPRGVRVRQPNTGKAPGLFNGHGGSPEDADDEARLRYFRLIDDEICKNVDLSLPLVLIGTTDHVAEYKSISRYKNIIDQSIEGNRTQDQLPELHAMTWQTVFQDIVQVRRSKLLEQFGDLLGQDRSLTDKLEIQKMAHEGRIDTLLVGMMLLTADTVKDSFESTATITFPEEYEVIESCVREVYSMSGKVVGISREHMPQQDAIAATLRY